MFFPHATRGSQAIIQTISYILCRESVFTRTIEEKLKCIVLVIGKLTNYIRVWTNKKKIDGKLNQEVPAFP